LKTSGSSHHNTPALNDSRQNINLIHRQALFMALEDIVIFQKIDTGCLELFHSQIARRNSKDLARIFVFRNSTAKIFIQPHLR
jgi:hypothetical protein